MGLMTLEEGQRWSDTAAGFQLEHARAILDTGGPVRQFWVEAPRGSRKTTDCAALLLSVLYAQAPRGARLYVGASDEDQAAELVDAARGLIDRTPELAGLFHVTELTITALQSGASVTALPADASAFGKRAYMIILDEVSNWPETRKARRFWSTLMSGNRKLAGCRTIVLSNSGDPAHWAWKRRETARLSDHWSFFSVPGPLPWLTAEDLAILQENSETPSEYERLHLNRWVTAEDRLASREDLEACTTLPGPLPPRPGVAYVVTLDVGIVHDRTALTVMHAEDTAAGRRVVLDQIDRWQGSRAAPVDLAAVRDTLIARAAEYLADAVVDPHQAVLIAQEARAAGVQVHEYTFTSASVGRLALSLHQAIRNHRAALPADEDLIDELAGVRLRKNNMGVYRLDHDSGQRDDQAVALALGTFWLLDGDPAPEFTIFDADTASGGGLAEIEVLAPLGGYAWRPTLDDPWAAIADEDQDHLRRRTVRVVQ